MWLVVLILLIVVVMVSKILFEPLHESSTKFNDWFCQQWNPDVERSVPVYAIVVHSRADGKQDQLQPGGKSSEGHAYVNSEGWVVTRRFKDFETLHLKLKEVLVC